LLLPANDPLSKPVRLFSIFLIAAYSSLSVLGQAGLHALADFQGRCCQSSTSVHGNSHHVFCHGHASEAHRDPAEGSEVCPFEVHRARANRPSQPAETPPHDSRNCRICEWHTKAQSGKIELVQLISEQALEVPVESAEVCRENYAPLAACSRGPPPELAPAQVV